MKEMDRRPEREEWSRGRGRAVQEMKFFQGDDQGRLPRAGGKVRPRVEGWFPAVGWGEALRQESAAGYMCPSVVECRKVLSWGSK